ncbi:MAG TPA: SAM-dependent methyltransferase [Bacteroidales bacterium]|nr:SAM-dependent methyltransferase [Bacteroidales bacterium]
MKGKLYLLPSTLGDGSPLSMIPPVVPETIARLRYFIVEDIRSARRYLKKTNPAIVIDELTFLVLNEHTEPGEIPALLEPMIHGNDAGLLSEAGLPCIADPGSLLVGMAHESGITVVPLPGPSSIFLALMASGFNGQNFAFHGYLPIDKKERIQKIREIESAVYTKDQTQVFIETPYRNKQMAEALNQACRPDTKICIAVDLTLPEEKIHHTTAKRLNPDHPSGLNKKPAVFLMYH